ncbi:signal peptidase II [Desulfomicrobium norvegicum]|uniref:Lipoprotein signal peptidase n=1 Tax=Desulfomicrobium norvegicum (strain DSM 1741 / NCIMB 8310) TaxID=52561 RepID=A0A8G2FEG5_DESNO|nr:signal peptidase II [Desulfomicrobium norvegicum]SFL76792.1 signal peptidase II [Desulfomicrobium norvegicum]
MPKVGRVPCKPDMGRRYRTIGLMAVVILVLDQLSKLWIQQTIPVWEKGFTVIPGFFDIVHILNRGAAFGFLNRHDIDWQRPFFIVVSILALGLIWVLARSQEDDGPFYVYGLGLILGGALGNLLDRARLGVVVDFLDFYVGDMHWPAFNVADMGICVGAAALLVSFYQQRRRCVPDNN